MFTQEGEPSKYHVASILSSMANGGQTSAKVTSYAIPSAAYSSAGIMSAATTNTLTPTTLGSLEQTFIELQSVPTTSTMQNQMTRSGFVPPVVTMASDHENSYGYGSDSSSMSEEDYLPSQPKKIRIGDKTTTIMSKHEIENPQRKTHRRQLREDQITGEEMVRRSLRRERNKVAAAKCRQRRVDHTNRLLNETDKLEQEQQSIESEIQALQNEKDQLEFILQSHSPLCKVNNGRVSGVKMDVRKDGVYVEIKQEPVITESSLARTKPSLGNETTATSRPSSLSLLKRDVRDMSSLSSTGISITTPSSVSGFLSFSLDSMVDHTGLTPLTGHLGHTGLTPLTNMPVSCSSEVKKQTTSSESSDGLKSPSSGLISL